MKDITNQKDLMLALVNGNVLIDIDGDYYKLDKEHGNIVISDNLHDWDDCLFPLWQMLESSIRIYQ